MKKVYLSVLALSVGAMLHAQTVLIEDDFESYEEGPYFGEHWNNWVGEDDDEMNIIISTDQAASGEQSGHIGMANDAGGQDVLLLMDQVYNSGIVTAEWKWYQPEGYIGYFNMQETTTAGESFAYSAFLNLYTEEDELPDDGGHLGQKIVWTFVQDETSYLYAYADIPLDEWFTIKQVMNFDEGTISFFVNDVEATYFQPEWGNSWPGDMGSFGAFDFFSLPADDPMGPHNTYYVDDVLITGENVGIQKVTKNDNSIKLYPNPSSGFVNISAEEVISSVEIYNISGQLVNTLQPNAKSLQVNTGDFPTGVYTAKIIMKDAAFSKAFVVK